MNFFTEAFMMEEAFAVVFPALISAIPSWLFGIASYVLTALALYTLASRRGLNNAWMSWVPVLNVWMIGSLSDQYRYVVKGEIKSRRKVLLILNLLLVLVSAVLMVIVVGVTVELVSDAMFGMRESEILDAVLGTALGATILALVVAGIAIAAAVIRYMALYDIYTSMDPDNNILFLVLSIFFGVTEPFFLFFNRNKDKGMPPRRPVPGYEVPPQPQWQPQEPAPRSWEEYKDYL